jgi:drug/metabolite transporter (DMT)-like permease
MGVYMVFFLEGMNRTGAAEGAIVLATAPIFTALLAVGARQEPFRLAVILWAVVAMGGVALVALGGDGASSASQPREERLLGDLLVLISALIWAWGAVLSKPLVGRHSPNTMLTVSMLGALPVLVPYGLLPMLSVNWTGLRPLTLGMLVYMALGAGVLGFIGFYAGVRQVGAPGAMLYQYCVSPLAAVFAYLVFGTSLAALQFVGFAGVVLGVSMAMRARRIDEKAAILAAQEPGTCA